MITVLILGYVGSKSFLEKVADIIKDLRKSNPALTYGKFYKTNKGVFAFK